MLRGGWLIEQLQDVNTRDKSIYLLNLDIAQARWSYDGASVERQCP